MGYLISYLDEYGILPAFLLSSIFYILVVGCYKVLKLIGLEWHT
ncbi:hypothetical protein bcere0005_23470 [Bacillus cereus 172560W]|nr:hypothetical protein bcere0005_23470 [Bacillus cereus 172560W]